MSSYDLRRSMGSSRSVLVQIRTVQLVRLVVSTLLLLAQQVRTLVEQLAVLRVHKVDTAI